MPDVYQLYPRQRTIDLRGAFIFSSETGKCSHKQTYCVGHENLTEKKYHHNADDTFENC